MDRPARPRPARSCCMAAACAWARRSGADPARGPRKGDTLVVTGKGRKQRMVPVLPAVRDAVDAYIAACPFPLAAVGPLFLGARGGPLNPAVAERQMRQLRAVLGLPEVGDASRPPAQLRHPSAGRRRRFAHDPGAAGPRRPVDHPALHRDRHRAADDRLRRRPSARPAQRRLDPPCQAGGSPFSKRVVDRREAVAQRHRVWPHRFRRLATHQHRAISSAIASILALAHAEGG